jgi:heterodisulfide reductase subunit C
LSESLPRASLRKLILEKTSQDVRRCRECAFCNNQIHDGAIVAGMDISLDSMVQMILWNDEEVLTSKTIWSEPLLKAVVHACSQGINLQAVILELRQEAHRRGLNGKEVLE